MPSTPFLTLALATTLFLNPAVATYKIVDDYTSNTSDFFSLFNFFTEPDPTQGFVSYQPYSSAVASKLIGRMPDNSIYIGVDYTTKLSVAFNSPGRASIRIEGKKSYNWGLMIADIWHMPDSTCGNWPAMWLLGSGPWPHGGEVDILEGVNDAVRNVVTLHTGEGCVVDRMEGGGTASESNSTSYMTRKSNSKGKTRSRSSASSLRPDSRDLSGTTMIQQRSTNDAGMSQLPYTGEMQHTNCDIDSTNQPKNVGCSIQAPEIYLAIGNINTSNSDSAFLSYGTPFNKNGGGIYATEWTASGISVWLFPYNGSDTSHITSSPDPKTWGPPMARFKGEGCDFEKNFKDLRIVFDNTFCGSWAGEVWEKEGCKKKTGAATCEEFVAENPEKFGEAFWGITGLKWFQDDEGI